MCFAELSITFKSGHKPFDLSPLKENKTIPNNKDAILFKPDELLFKDKPRYLQLIGGQIDQFLITKDEQTAPILSMLGVRSLSKAVIREPRITGDKEPFPDLEEWLEQLSPLIRQVMLQGGLTADVDLPIDLVGGLSILVVDSISEAFYLPMDKTGTRRLTVSEPLPTTAFLENDERLYVTEDYSLTDLAHQLALYLNPDIDGCTVVAQLETLIGTESFEEAQDALYRWGYDVFDRRKRSSSGVEGAVAGTLGDEDDSESQPLEQEQPRTHQSYTSKQPEPRQQTPKAWIPYYTPSGY